MGSHSAARSAVDTANADADRVAAPTSSQLRWLARGLTQAGGKLPLFDERGQRVSDRTVRSCIEKGWAEPWFSNPLKPDWFICKLTERGRHVLGMRGGGDGAGV